MKKNIQDCFRGLIVSLPYEKITVCAICQEAAVSRAAFYDLFANKEAIIKSIVDDDVINPQKELLRFMTLTRFKSSSQISMELQYVNIQKNADFYKRLNRIEGGNLLIRILTEAFTDLCRGILNSIGLPEDEEQYTAFFFAVGEAALISKWLDNNMDLKPARLAQLYNKWTMDYWRKILPEKPNWELSPGPVTRSYQ